MSPSPAATRPAAPAYRAGLFLAALALFLGASYLALTQAPRPFPLKPDTAWEAFYYPVERNAFARMPRISENLNDVFVVPDSGDVWVVGEKGLILHSRDGGARWERSGKQKTVEDLHAVFFIDRDHGWAAGKKGTLLATRDRGETWWIQATGSTEDLFGMQFLGDGRGWVVGSLGTILVSADGGRSWKLQQGIDRTLFAEGFSDVRFAADGRRGWVVGKRGQLLATENGGKTWLRQDSGTKESLYGVEISADGLYGWAVGVTGTILETKDGGKYWRSEDIGQGNPWLYSVQVLANGRRGWAVGTGGTILGTVDGGQTWRRQASGSSQHLFGVRFQENGLRGWAVGAGGTILATADGGETWRPQAFGGVNRLLSVQFMADGRRGWAMGDGRTILATTDGGESWRPQASGGWKHPWSGQFLADGLRGWAVGDAGTILRTVDGGKTWRPADPILSLEVRASPPVILHSVWFLEDGLRGWAVGSGSTILATVDGGKTWQPQASLDPADLRGVQFLADGRRGWAVGSEGTLLATTDGGQTWRRQASGSTEELYAVQFLEDGPRGWAVGSGGTILATADGGMTWQPQVSGSKEDLRGVQFLEDGQQGWAVGGRGTILATADGGRTWRPHAIGGTDWLYSVQFLEDGRRGWVVGQEFTILSTTDGGQTWHKVQYRRYPAPWYWPACILALALAWLALRHRPKSAETTIADLLASDRPLRPGDPDALDFSAIALGVSRFLRNPRTEPPLTLAVSGEWGTGKSSLMNLIRHDLAKAGFATVWFNAWHHQKGEQLLASLFANLRAQASPKAFSRAGLRFRLNLLARRSRRHWLLALALAGFGGLALAFLLSEASHLGQAFRDFSAQGGWTVDRGQALLESIPVLGGLATVLVSVYRAAQGFGLDPSKLIASVAAGTGKPVPLHPGARFQFAREFEDVTAALKPGRLVIFIDDLDRCSKENVVEVLESINFLVSSGDCYIVLGMAREWVEICVALGFKELAEETSAAEDPEGHRDHRREFARKYLQKLVNIEVPLPRLDAGDSLRLLPRGAEEEALPSLLEQGWRGFSAWIHGWRNALVLAGLAAFGLAVGWGLKPRFAGWIEANTLPVAATPPARTQALELPVDRRLLPAAGGLPAGLSAGDAPAPPEGTELVLRTDWEALEKGIVLGRAGEAEWVLKYRPGPFVGPPAPPVKPVKPSEPIDRERHENPKEPEPTAAPPYTPGQDNAASTAWLPVAPGLVFAGLALGWLLRSPVKLTEDSDDFLTALALWHPWIAAACPTPRLVKRFLNRLRYLAMRHRPPEPAPAPWHRRVLGRLRHSPPESPAEAGFDERALVALGAIYEFRREWVVADGKFGRLAKGEGRRLFLDERSGQGETAGETVERVADVTQRLDRSSLLNPLQALSKADWAKARALRERFLEAVGEVKMG